MFSLTRCNDSHGRSELEICLELPPSGLRMYEAAVALPTSHYDEEGMYYLLALSSLRKLMVEVVNAVWTKGLAIASCIHCVLTI